MFPQEKRPVPGLEVPVGAAKIPDDRIRVRTDVPNDVFVQLKGWRTAMNVAQIKDEIRNLNQIDKIELFTWIDREVSDLLCRIGSSRSLEIRREIEQKHKVTGPKRSAQSGNDHVAVNYATQASP
jgi:hypothetical protein